MVYNWDGKEAECYQLYVQEKRSLGEVMEYWEQQGFTPSKRAFQTQFKRWDFPSKQNPAHKNPALIDRVKQLWEKNYMQKDMVDALQAEGFEINDRELTRLRLRFRLFLRENANRVAKRKATSHAAAPEKKKRKQPKLVAGNALIDQLANAILQDEDSTSDGESEEEGNVFLQEGPREGPATTVAALPQQPLEPAEALRRQARQQQLQTESDEKWRTRKRRRRTRGWAGLPADAPGEPPRFPSETTIDESKAYLGLDNKLYKQMRDQFQCICQAEGVIKKTVAGPEKWAQILQRLVRENAHLSNVFQHDADVLQQSDALWRPKNHKALSLDVICQDVTKRMRVMDSRMGIPEAKNALGLNPEQTRRVRDAFLAILKAEQFTNKFEITNERWNQLKQQWVQESDILCHAVKSPDSAPESIPVEKLKAIEMLARDVMKRLRAENNTKDPSRRKQASHGPGPGPAPPSVAPHASNSLIRSRTKRTTNNRNAALPQTNSTIQALAAGTDLQIDPSLLLAASDAAIIPPAPVPTAHELAQSQHQHGSIHHPLHNSESGRSSYLLSAQTSFHSHTIPASLPLPIYFRLHPHSSTPLPSKTVWLSVLQAGTVAEVRSLAMREHPGTVVVKLEGLVVHRADGVDREVVVAVDDDAELSAYLGHVGGGKATFVVLLSTGGGNVGAYT